MDGLDLFRKLGVGAKFNFKRFQSDAEVLKIVQPSRKPTTSRGIGKDTPCSPSVKRKWDSDAEEDALDEGHSPAEDEEDEDTEDLQILGSIRSKEDVVLQSTKDKRKKKKRKKQTLTEKHQEQVNHFRKVNKIHVYGSDIPDPGAEFDDLALSFKIHRQVVENVKSSGFTTPTPIQMQAVPVMMMRREILACAPTGSGKTLAFILPILHQLKEPRRSGFRAVVLAPTRELAQQTHREFTRVAAGTGFRIHAMDKVKSAQKKLGAKFAKKFDILVTTPNRLVFMLQQDPPLIELHMVEWLVVDECDKLFEVGKHGFREQLAMIYKACDSCNVRRAMFSATFAYDVEQWCKLNLDNVVQVYVGAKNVATETVQQELLYVGEESGKLLAVRDIIRGGLQPPVLVFVQSKDRAKELFHELIYDGINVDVIHSDRTQLQRDNVVRCFRSGKIWILICTDLMGRGMDFKGVNLVINYDFPNSAISYIHRIGRTGRAGRPGRAVTLFTEEDKVSLRGIANVMREAGCPVPPYMLHIHKPKKHLRRKMSRSQQPRSSIRTFPQKDAQGKNKRNSQAAGLRKKSENRDAVATTQDHQSAATKGATKGKNKHKPKKT